MLKVQIINKGHQPLPAFATPQSAGMDLRANIDEAIYIQSQDYGFGYLFSVGIPSLFYTKKYENTKVTVFEENLNGYVEVGKVKTMWFERRANKKAEKYFRDNYGDKWHSTWNYRHYPIDVK